MFLKNLLISTFEIDSALERELCTLILLEQQAIEQFRSGKVRDMCAPPVILVPQLAFIAHSLSCLIESSLLLKLRWTSFQGLPYAFFGSAKSLRF